MARPGILLPFKDRSGAEALIEVVRSVCPSAIVVAYMDEGELAGRFSDTQFCDALLQRPGPILAIAHVWNELAGIAYRLGADYTILLGDDVDIIDRYASLLFTELEKEFQSGDYDIVVAREERAPGWPSFPAVSVRHWDRFGKLFPADFVNQEADPFLYELYRRFGRAKFTSRSLLVNNIGGVRGGLVSDDVCPRYTPNNSLQWEPLLDQWSAKLVPYKRLVTLDIVIPSMRYVENQDYIRKITELASPSDMDHRVVVVLDGPVTYRETWEKWRSFELESRDLCLVLRVNKTRLGAGMSRQRGIDESKADYILCLDDDCIVDKLLLFEYGQSILSCGQDCDGIVGLTEIPFQGMENLVTTGAHYSYLTFFFRIALHMHGKRVPWGVTANLLMRRLNLRFQSVFSKSGGGEDVDLCVGKNLIGNFRARVTHPWWSQGRFLALFWRFFRWAYCDSELTRQHPTLSSQLGQMKYQYSTNECSKISLTVQFVF